MAKVIDFTCPRYLAPSGVSIGTGPGFFAIIMAQVGHHVTAVDATAGMLEQAESNARHYHVYINFIESDVHSLPFDKHSFDLIITRNVTWNLKRPDKAYQEWYRILKKDGRLINFDANWYLHLFDDVYKPVLNVTEKIQLS